MISFSIDDKTVSVFSCISPNRPVVYLNLVLPQENDVYRVLQSTCCKPFNLVTISGLDWNRDMTPWEAPALSSSTLPFTGGSGAYLRLLKEEIVPAAEKEILGLPVWRGIAGYSLAGLFALFCAYQTNLFSRIASISGSLWFPGIKEYVFTHQFPQKPDRIYFSLGNKECKTRNRFMKDVQRNTEEIAARYDSMGISTVFQLNPGNHFTQTEARIADGIAWISEDA